MNEFMNIEFTHSFPSISIHVLITYVTHDLHRKGRFVRADAEDSHTPFGSNMEELLAVAAQAESGDDEGDSPSASVSEKGIDSTSSSFTINHGLDLLEQAIQFDDEDSRLPPGKRMRRHTIV